MIDCTKEKYWIDNKLNELIPITDNWKKEYSALIKDLVEGEYYWVKDNENFFIAQFEGEYWMTDISTETGEFLAKHIVIEKVMHPKDVKGLLLL